MWYQQVVVTDLYPGKPLHKSFQEGVKATKLPASSLNNMQYRDQQRVDTDLLA